MKSQPMKFTITAQTLLTELAFLSSVAERKSTMLSLQYLSIVSQDAKTLKISATDIDVTLSCEIETLISQPGAILVPAAKLLAITKSVPKAADMTFQSLPDGGAKLTCERTSFKLQAPQFDSFPQIVEPQNGTINIPTDIFANMITSTIFAITQEESRYTLSGAKLEIDQTSLRMITTDGHRLVKSENSSITTEQAISLIVPRKALAELAKISAAHNGHLSLAADENHIYFQAGPRSLTARLLFGQFPNYEMVIPKNNSHSFNVDISAFRETLKRISLMADERSHSIRMDIKPSQLTFSASTPNDGEAVENVPIDFEGEETAIGFNSQYLLEAYSSLSSNQATMSFKDGNSQVMVVPATPTLNQVCNVIMPLRLN
jgi:DNA polymerase-3 subunit beta